MIHQGIHGIANSNAFIPQGLEIREFLLQIQGGRNGKVPLPSLLHWKMVPKFRSSIPEGPKCPFLLIQPSLTRDKEILILGIFEDG